MLALPISILYWKNIGHIRALNRKLNKKIESQPSIKSLKKRISQKKLNSAIYSVA